MSGKSCQGSGYKIKCAVLILHLWSTIFWIILYHPKKYIYCINCVWYSCAKNTIYRLPFGSHFSPDKHRKKGKYSLCHENFKKGNKTTNQEGIHFFDSPWISKDCIMIIIMHALTGFDLWCKNTIMRLTNSKRQWWIVITYCFLPPFIFAF